MSGSVGGVGSSATAYPFPKTATPQPKAPADPATAALQLPEDQAFKVSTINQRLASLAAERAGDQAGGVDLKV